MDILERLKRFYRKNPPRLSYGGTEGEGMRGKVYAKWPEEGELSPLGLNVVWHGQFAAAPETPAPDGYCVVDVCLDPSGHKNPDAIPLFPEMKGHALRAVVYVDGMNRIQMRAISGITFRRPDLAEDPR